MKVSICAGKGACGRMKLNDSILLKTFDASAAFIVDQLGHRTDH